MRKEGEWGEEWETRKERKKRMKREERKIGGRQMEMREVAIGKGKRLGAGKR